MPAIAFMFGMDELDEVAPGSVDDYALRVTIAPLLEVDRGRVEAAQIRVGMLLLHDLAYRPADSRFEGGQTGMALTGVRTTQRPDMGLWTTLVWDFWESQRSVWSSAHEADLVRNVSHLNVLVVALSALSSDVAREVDRRLAGEPFYIGAFEVDTGNPILQAVTVNGLPHVADIVRGELILDPWDSEVLEVLEDPVPPPPPPDDGEQWWSGLPLADARYGRVDGFDFSEAPAWPTAPISERGALSAMMLAKRRRPTHLERLAVELAQLEVDRETPGFEIDVDAMPRASDAVIEKSKLVGYALSPEHETGRHKARLFDQLLGIRAADWEYLAGQLRQGLADAPVLLRVRSEEHGIKYHALTPVQGLNGASRIVLSAWEVRPNEPPRLTTAYVADSQADAAVARPRVLPPALTGAERWQALWDLAHECASEQARIVVATPMRVDGEWIERGMFGFAWIVLPDARRSFARWLVANDHARVQRRRGAIVRTGEHMIDPARAYAEEFSEILRLNGVESRVEWRLD